MEKKDFDRHLPYNNLPDLPKQAEWMDNTAIYKNLALASRNLGELNGLCASLPDPQLLINTVILQESKESSAIENIVTTQDELYQANAESETASPAAKEVLVYREALYAGLDKMTRQKNLLLTNTFIEIMQTIKQNQAGIRTSLGTALKNTVSGEIIYTPPCCEDIVRRKLKSLEDFINDDDSNELDPLIKMAMIHYQFEAIHPFTDGNGRTGRILNALYLVQQGLLTQPVLYLSAYIVKNKPAYYSLLREVTEKENWTDWILYVLTAIRDTSRLTINKIREMLVLKEELETQMKKVLGNSYDHSLLQLMFTLPYLKIEILDKRKIAHRQTASVWLKKLVDAGIMRTEKKGRSTYYINKGLIDIFS